MGYKVTLDVGDKYTGCKELIPGSVYLDNKGEEILFVGFGKFEIRDCQDFHNMFIYMKVKQIKRKFDKGVLSKDLHNYYGEDMYAPMLLYTSQKPRLLRSFLYEMFPSDYFERFGMTQHYKDGYAGLTEVKIDPTIVPFVCTVQYL